MHTPATARLPRMLTAALLASAAVACARAQQPGPAAEVVTRIEGGGQVYIWTVRNLATVPIVRIVLPHYRGDLWEAPPGWKTEGTTHLVNVGAKQVAGVCVAEAPDPLAGIPPLGTGEFRLRLARGGARLGHGEVTIGLADGRVVRVPDVELPAAPPWFEPYVTPLAVGGVLVLLIAINRVRRRRARAGAPAAGGPPDA